MIAWTSDVRGTIEATEEFEFASVRHDGTLPDLMAMWVVRDGNDLYVRSVNGRDSSSFRGDRVYPRHASGPARSRKMRAASRRTIPMPRSTWLAAPSTASATGRSCPPS